jgi:hypothetical protein
MNVAPKVAAPLKKLAILPDEWQEVIESANKKLIEGLGLKKSNQSIELVPKPIDLNGSSFPTFDVEVKIGGKTTGHMAFDAITDIDAADLAKARKPMMGDVEKEFGVIRDENFPFTFNENLKGQGLNAEMNEAINQSLKERGFRMYSSKSHTDEGHRTYTNMTERGIVEPMISERNIPIPSNSRDIQRQFDHNPDAYISEGRIQIPEYRYRFNRSGGRVGDSWPPDNDIYNRDQQIAYAKMLQQLALDYDAAQARLDQGEIGPTPTYPNLSPYPTIQATELSPELREERGRANPAFQVMDFLTPVGDVTAIAGGIGDLLRGEYGSGAFGVLAGVGGLAIPGSLPTGKASTKLAQSAGKKGVSIKAIKQAAAGKDVSEAEASILNMLAERAEKAGMTHVDPGNMQRGGMQRHPRFPERKGPEWDEFYGTDRLMGVDWTNTSNTDAAVRAARNQVTSDSEVILLRGNESVYGKGSSKHFYGDRGEGYVPTAEDLENPKRSKEPLRGVGVHAHVRALPDPWETTKAKRGEPSRNVRTMLEIQSDAFQANKRGRWNDTYDFGDEPIYGSMEMHRMAAESPERIEEIFENVEHVGQQVIGYLRDKGFKKGESLQDALGLGRMAPTSSGQVSFAQHRNVGLLNDYGGAGVGAPEGEVAGFSKLLKDLIDGGDITRKEADDFLVAYSRFGGEGHYDFNFSEHVTDAESQGRRTGMADDLDMEVEKPNVTREHPWIRMTSELVDIGVNQMRREVKDPGFLKHVEKVKKMPNPDSNPMGKTWEREALAAFFEDGANKGAEAYRIPTPETVRTIQGWDPNGDFDMILGRYKGLPDQMKKMGVDVNRITPVTDGFGNTWLEIPRSAVPSSVKVFKRGGRLKVKKANKGMRIKKCV